jgi:predicted HAD superfamily hydrolase
MEDPRICDLARLVDSGRYDVLSLDLFDTVVWRKAPTPADAFFLVADALREGGWVYPSSSRESFVRERIACEDRARRKVPSREVTLGQIVAEFPRGYLRGIEPGDLEGIELAVERRIVCVNDEFRTLIARARERRLKVAFVSDTYFSREQIGELVGIEPDLLLLSCEEGLSKLRGLHQRLLERLRVEPGRVLHVGNDPIADIEGPGALGIERYWFRTIPDAFREILDIELPSTSSGRAALLAGDDGGLTSLRGRAMFHGKTEYEQWGIGVLGPVVTGYAEWVAQRCRELSIGTALCLMREGRILRQALDSVVSGLAARELYISRYAARKAAIFGPTEEEVLAFVRRPSAVARGKLLHDLGLDASDLSEERRREPLSPDETVRLVRRLLADRAARRRILASSEQARSGLLAHVRPLLAGCGPAAAVVDLGYNGTIQQCLQRILDHEGAGVRTHGLYLVTGGEVARAQAAGAVVEGWLAENGQPVSMAHTFMRTPEIVEQSLMADCGTTLGYTEDGSPVLDEPRIEPEQRAQIGQIQTGIEAYLKAWKLHCGAHGTPDAHALRPLYRAILIRSVARPLDLEVDLFGDWKHDENFGSAKARGLAQPAGLGDWEAAHLSAHQLASLPMTRLHWPFGFARRISPAMADAVAHIFLRTADPDVFDSAHPAQHLLAYWDTGQGFRAEEGNIVRYSLNNRGRVWQRMSIPAQAGWPQRIGLTIGLPDQVLQITGVVLRTSSKGAKGVEIRVPHEEIEKHGYAHLGGDLYRVIEDPALLVISTGSLPQRSGPLTVDLFFGLIPAVAA